MNFIELQEDLQNLIPNFKITQMSIANVLNLSRQTMSKRVKLNTEVSVSELQKIENYFGVSLYKSGNNSGERQNDTSIPDKVQKFGQRLTEIQDKNEYLDIDMAKLLNISREQYNDIVNGNKTPDFNTLNRIKQCFKISIDWLLYGE